MKQQSKLMSGAALAVLALAPGWAAHAQDSKSKVEDVVITATHTGLTNLQKTPISVDVVSGNDLTKENIRTFKDLMQIVPSLSVAQNDQGTNYYIRGVGGSNGNADDTDVGLYMDNVYIARPTIITLTDFNDIDRVEVVEGPQGTLFGRNSAGGAVNFITRAPPTKFEFQDTLNLGNFNLVDEAARIGGPLANNVQGSLAVSYVNHNGYEHNIYPGGADVDAANRMAVRGAVKWEITPDITDIVRFSSLYTDENWYVADNLAAPQNYPDPLADSTVGNFSKVDVSLVPHNRENAYLGSNELNWKINDNLSLKSITAETVEQTHPCGGIIGIPDGGDTCTVNTTHDFTQEFNLINHYGNLSGVVGYFYFNEMYKFLGYGWFGFAPPPLTPTTFSGAFYQITEMPTTSNAVFIHETYQFTPTISVTGGVRYTTETRGLINEINVFLAGPGVTNLSTGLAANPATIPCVEKGQSCNGNYVGNLSAPYTATTPMISLNWQATPDSMIYVSATEGYKSGGFNFTYAPQSAYVPPNFGPETVWSYELGAKNDLFDHTLRLNAALFYYNWTGLQFSSLVAPAVSTVANAGNAHSLGFELNSTWKPAPGWTFTGGLTALSTRYDQFNKYAILNGFAQYLTGNPNYNAAAGTYNASGNQLANAAPLAFNITAQKDFDMSDGANLFIRGEYQYLGKVFFDPMNVAIDSRPAVSFVNASIGYSPAHSNWQFALWGKNLANELTPTGSAAYNPLGYAISDPRTYGVRINYTY